MEKEKVSIITAVYKAEEFLDRCVNSILNQTYKNLEIILVDDGSPDGCPRLCDEYAQKDKRVKVVHKPNGGVSSAWNAGLDNATGEYIAFVDSDDWVESTYIEDLYEVLKKNDADISICWNNLVDDKNIILDNWNNPNIEKFYTANECLNVFFGEQEWRHTSWGKLYRKYIFDRLRYPEHIKCVEDSYIICDICKNVKNGIATTTKVLYNYVIQDRSVSRTINEKRFDWIHSKHHILEQISPSQNAYKFACKHLFLAYRSTYLSFKKFRRKDLIKKLNAWLKKDYKKYIKYLHGRERIKNQIFRYNRTLFNLIYSLVNNKNYRKGER